ncbi:HEAT repeat domain-containing protein [Calothrix sp. 336/3]|uniref:HEAT repeat domain-containing protein n=1 Tax=Calothrix sp. 336/3 TaxID=1337936 RepID=UPI0004E32A73|nr:HEAT repeat domain-containing protein [Calothrix sp. 336/3]
MVRNSRRDDSVLENAIALVAALLELGEQELGDVKAPLVVRWENHRLRVTGYTTKQISGKRSRTSEVGTTKQDLLTQIKAAGKSLKCPKNMQLKELDEIQIVLDSLRKLGLFEDERLRKNAPWKFSLTLKHQTATIEANLEVIKRKWREHPKNSSSQNSPIPEISNTSINWHNICGEMLRKYKRLTTNQLLLDDDTKFEFDEIHVPLALVERTKTEKRQENISPEFGSQLLQPSEYQEKQKFKHDDFLEQILQQGNGKTQGKRIALIGEPGAGKTTLLQAIAFWILDKNLGLPIWISLADLQLPDGSLKDFREHLQESWLGRAIANVTPAIKTEFTNQITSGQVWLLLDGVDEIAMSNSSPLEAISSQLVGWIAKSRVVLTCRVNVWEGNLNALEDFETYRLLDFNYPSDVKQFIENWFKPRNSHTTNHQAEELWQELSKPGHQRIQDLVKNPLRLTLLCATWQSSAKGLPETKAGLYSLFVNYFYKWKSNRFKTKEKQQRELNTALGELAKIAIDGEVARFRLKYGLVSSVLGDADEEDSLFCLALKLGWLNKVGIAAESDIQEEVYAFYHPTFQEYFAGKWLAEYVEKQKEGQQSDEELQWNYLNHLKWTEPAALMMGLLSNEGLALRVVRLALQVDWQLGARLAGEVKVEWQEKTVALVKSLNIPPLLKIRLLESAKSNASIPELMKFLEYEDSDVRYRAVHALREIKSETAIPGLIKLLQHENRDVRYTAAILLEDITSEDAIPELIKIIKLTDYENSNLRSIAQSALGKIESQSAIMELIKLLEYEDNNIRWNAEYALGKIKSKASIPQLIKLLEHDSLSVRSNVIKALGEIKYEAAIPKLIQLLQEDSYVRKEVIEALKKMESESSTAELIKLIKYENSFVQDDSSFVRRNAISALGEIKSEAAIPQLLKLLEDGNSSVRWLAVYALREIKSEAAIPELIQCLKDDDIDVRIYAEKTLIEIKSETVISALVKYIENENYQTDNHANKSQKTINYETNISKLVKLLNHKNYRKIALFALGQLKSEEAIPGLIALIKYGKHITYEDRIISEKAVDTLIHINSEQAIPGLIEIIECVNPGIRGNYHAFSGALRALTEINSEVAFSKLIQLLEYQNYRVRDIVKSALEKIEYPVPIVKLITLLHNANDFVSAIAVKLLIKSKSDAKIPELIKLLDNEDYSVRKKAIFALANIKSEAAIPGLMKILEDEDFDKRSRAAIALTKIKCESAIPGLIKSLEDKNIYLISGIRPELVNALGEIKSEKAIPHLIKLCSGSYEELSISVASALGKIKSEAAIPGLIQLLEDENTSVSDSAASALGEIKSEVTMINLINILNNQNLLQKNNGYNALYALESLEEIQQHLGYINHSQTKHRKLILFYLH